MRKPRRLAGLAALLCAFSTAYAAPHLGASVLMVSVDGMKPEYVTHADEHGLKLPFLRRFLSEGTYAQGVEGVWPTNTYPSHTTLVTGVEPAVHGIYTNLEFDPKHTFGDAWYWYAAQNRATTLWEVAQRAGLATASVGWPVTVGESHIDTLVPEYWRVFRPAEDLDPSDRHLIAELSRPAGWLVRAQATLGPYLAGNDVSVDADETKTRFALEILKTQKPRFMTLHLGSLDEAEHEHAPFSAAANQTLEAIDGMLARLAATQTSFDPAASVVVVSDHGFTTLTHRVNLLIPFLQAGLIETAVDPETQAAHVIAWKAEPWLASGMAAIMLHDANDTATLQAVQSLLTKLASDPENGIERILTRDEIRTHGAFPDAAFLVVMKLGYYAAANVSGPLVTEIHEPKGGHGFAATLPDMRASFFIMGETIARHRDLGVIDMRRIAPTVAALLGAPMPSAQGAPLPVRQ